MALSRFRFRAWHNTYKRMSVHFGIEELAYSTYDDGIWSPDDGYNTWDHNQYVLMQSTGLSDANGVEIFESDIVQQQWDRFINQVWFNVDAGRWYVNCSNTKDAIQCHAELEILGNIYENPELLEDI